MQSVHGCSEQSSPTFSVWQKLYHETEEPVTLSEANPQGTTAACSTTATPSTSTASTASAPLNTTASLTSAAPSTSEKCRAGTEPASCQSHSTERVLREILTFPTLEASGPPKCKNVKRSIPNFVNFCGPESMQILLDEKLKKARQLAEKQKKLQERENKKGERRKKQEEEKLNKEKRKKERADRKKKDQGNSGSKRARKSDIRVKQVEEKNDDRIWWRMKKISVASASRGIFPLMVKTTLGSFAKLEHCLTVHLQIVYGLVIVLKCF